MLKDEKEKELKEIPRKTTTLIEAGFKHVYNKKHNFAALGQWMMYYDQVLANEKVKKRQKISPIAMEKLSFCYFND